MADEQKAGKGFQNFCQRMRFGDGLKKIMEAEKGSLPCNCAEMMSRMKNTCCGSGEKKEEDSPAPQENPAPKI